MINKIEETMTKEEFEKVFAETAEKSGVAGMARSCFFAKNLQRMMIDLRDKLYPAEQQSNSLDKIISSLLETYPTNKNEVPTEALNDYHQGLICGARKTYNWILESAIDGCHIKRNGYTQVNVLNGFSTTCETIQKFKDGDKVKVIIIKEDEQ